MNIPLQISFREIAPSEAITRAITERAERLDHICDRIIACRVMVEAPHRHHNKGKNYRVRIDLSVPGDELVVGRDRSHNGDHEDVYLSIRDAFDAIERQLRAWTHKRRGFVKAHAERPPTPPPAPAEDVSFAS